MEVVEAWTVKALGTFSVAGSQMKAPAQRRQQLRCRCGWSIMGLVVDEQFHGDPATQVFPSSVTSADEPGDEHDDQDDDE